MQVRGLPGTPKTGPKSPHGKAAGSAKKGRFMAFLTGVKKPGARCSARLLTASCLPCTGAVAAMHRCLLSCHGEPACLLHHVPYSMHTFSCC